VFLNTEVANLFKQKPKSDFIKNHKFCQKNHYNNTIIKLYSSNKKNSFTLIARYQMVPGTEGGLLRRTVVT